jgi:hypothetical protein
MILLRTIYIWHAIALFTKDRYGDFMKPTEGVPENVYNRLKKNCHKYGGCWIWICTSKSTDFLHKGKQKVSYVLGAVYVVDVISTQIFNKQYPKQRLKREYKHSIEYDYQAIIPSHDYARIEFPTPLIVHNQLLSELRWTGLWTPYEGAPILNQLAV